MALLGINLLLACLIWIPCLTIWYILKLRPFHADYKQRFCWLIFAAAFLFLAVVDGLALFQISYFTFNPLRSTIHRTMDIVAMAFAVWAIVWPLIRENRNNAKNKKDSFPIEAMHGS